MKLRLALFSFLVVFVPFRCFASHSRSKCTFGCFGPYERKCTKVKCVMTDTNGVTMKYFSGHVIANHTIVGGRFYSQMNAEESACVKECIRIQTCITILVDKLKKKCWFYQGDDVYANPERIQKKDGCKIISLGNGVCRTQSCNFGKCIPDYNTGKYTCRCDPGYVGDICNVKVGPKAHFSFDTGTVDHLANFTHLQLHLDKGKLVRVPDRRGKVLMAGNNDKLPPDNNALTVIAEDKRAGEEMGEKTKWFSNFFLAESNMTVSFWIKMDERLISDADLHLDRHIFRSYSWSLVYNGAKKRMIWYVGRKGDEHGTSEKSNRLESCAVYNVRRWNYFVIAGCGDCGVFDYAKLYYNGKRCKLSAYYRQKYKPDGNAAFSWFAILDGVRAHQRGVYDGFVHRGITLFDEMKIFSSFPTGDDAVRKQYEKERKELMT